MTRSCPRCQTGTDREPAGGKLKCRNCGAEWKVETDVLAADLFAELDVLGAQVDRLSRAPGGGGVCVLSARGVSITHVAQVDEKLLRPALLKLRCCLAALEALGREVG